MSHSNLNSEFIIWSQHPLLWKSLEGLRHTKEWMLEKRLLDRNSRNMWARARVSMTLQLMRCHNGSRINAVAALAVIVDRFQWALTAGVTLHLVLKEDVKRKWEKWKNDRQRCELHHSGGKIGVHLFIEPQRHGRTERGSGRRDVRIARKKEKCRLSHCLWQALSCPLTTGHAVWVRSELSS